MTQRLRDLRLVLDLFLRDGRWRPLAACAAATATLLSGIALLGLSGWFIVATSIAGLSMATALAFDVFAPSAAIRLLALGRTASRYGERMLTHDVALRAVAALRTRLFLGWAGPDAARRLLAHPGRLLFRLTADADALDALYLRMLVPLAAALACTAATGLLIAWLDPWSGVAIAAWMLASSTAILAHAARRSIPLAQRRTDALETLRLRTIDLASGQTDLLMTGRIEAARTGVLEAEQALARADDALQALESRTALLQGLAAAASLAGMLAAAAAWVENGTAGVSLAALAVLAVLAAAEPLAALRRGALDAGRTALAVRRLAPRLRDADGPDADGTASPRPASHETATAPADASVLALANVSATHPGSTRRALRDVTLRIAPGEHVALIGRSGAGKSSLLALAAGQLHPAEGQALLPAACWLTQRTELFADSVRENLRLAAPHASDERLWHALGQAGLADVVRGLPAGLDTALGERGQGLSVGQARRLALARLLLHPARLWLLDEPTEGLDAETARDVLARLHAHAQGRTLLVATHARRDAAHADRLLLIESGVAVADIPRHAPGFAQALASLRPD